MHTRPAIARSASKKRRQQRADSGKVSPIKLEDTDEQEKKKVGRHVSFAVSDREIRTMGRKSPTPVLISVPVGNSASCTKKEPTCSNIYDTVGTGCMGMNRHLRDCMPAERVRCMY